MNGDSLRKTHSDTYARFFSGMDTSYSSPFVINWSGDIFANYRWISIKQKIPLRMYVGSKRTQSDCVTIGKISVYERPEQRFNEYDAYAYAPFFHEFLAFFQKRYPNVRWLELHFLSEIPRGMWLGFTALVPLLMKAAFERAEWGDGIPRDDIERKEWFHEAFELEMRTRKRLPVEDLIGSCLDGGYPVVTFSDSPSARMEWTRNPYWYALDRLDSAIVSPYPYIPIDVSLVYSGRPVLVDHIYETGEHGLEWTKSIKTRFRGLFENNVTDHQPDETRNVSGTKNPNSQRKEHLPEFYRTFIDTERDAIRECYGELLGANSLEILNLMSRLYAPGYTENSMRLFIEAVNKIRYSQSIAQRTSHTLTNFVAEFLHGFGSDAKSIGIMPNDTSIMGGTLVCVTPLEWFRQSMDERLQEMGKKVRGSCSVYQSWNDGTEKEGLRLEQDLERWIISDSVSGSAVLRTYADGSTLFRIGSLPELRSEPMDWLYIDCIDGRISMNGKRLTSKEIKSQSSTIGVLLALLANSHRECSANNLPNSSYAKSKNEMSSKIIVPINQLFWATGYASKLECRGKEHEFSIRMEIADLTICVLSESVKTEKLFRV